MKGCGETSAGSVFPEVFAAVWQRDGGKMARVWPSHRAGRLTASGPSWRAEDRQEWKKCFEVATHPLTTKPERERESLDSSSSSSERHPPLFFCFWRREEKMKWGRGSERGELFRGPGAASGVKERRNFDSLSFGEEKIKPGPFPPSEMCQHSGNEER